MTPKPQIVPGPAARELGRFIERMGIGFREAAEQLDTAHPALLAWLKGVCKPDAYRRLAIELWSSGTVVATAWLSEREKQSLKKIKPLKRAA